MPGRELPDAAKAFLMRRIESPDFLDVLALLQAGGERSWTPDQIAQALDLDQVAISRALVALRQSGILKVAIDEDLHYRYAPSATAAEAVGALLARYREDPREIMELIATRPRQKLRIFADAFRIRRDD
jgi:DNA-binding transcriptional ArsR family regulator